MVVSGAKFSILHCSLKYCESSKTFFLDDHADNIGNTSWEVKQLYINNINITYTLVIYNIPITDTNYVKNKVYLFPV